MPSGFSTKQCFPARAACRTSSSWRLVCDSTITASRSGMPSTGATSGAARHWNFAAYLPAMAGSGSQTAATDTSAWAASTSTNPGV